MTVRILLVIVVVLQFLPSEILAEYRYRLYLDGKPGSEVVSLSERALERRERLGIETDSADLEVSPQYLEALTEADLRIVTKSHWLNTVVVMRQDGKSIPDTVLQAFPFVTGFEILTTTQRATSPVRDPEDIENAEQGASSGISPVDTPSSPLRQLNALNSLYRAGYRGEGMLIAVLDAGFLKVNQWSWLVDRVIGTRDMYARSEEASKIYTSDSHGACCLSIMATPEEHGIYGSAQDAKYYLVRTETTDSETGLEEDMWVAGAELADSIGADLISSSLGYYEFDEGLDSHTQSEFALNTVHISRGAKVACDKGILVCNAAGNEGSNAWKKIIYPADVEDVLTVGGVNPDGLVSYFSSRGFTVPYIKPDVLARATRCYTVNTSTSTGAATSSGSGTSYATPLIAGLCASLWSAVPTLTPAQLREAVRQSASYAQKPDSIHGYGIPDFAVALSLAREWTGTEAEGIERIYSNGKDDIQIQYAPTGQPMGADRNQGLVIQNGRVVFRRDN